jgi:hypothetical protein
MSLKDRLFAEGMRLSQSPAMAKLLADERFMRMAVAAMSMPGRVATFSAEQKERFAKEMGLATADEVRDLKRQVAGLEDALRRLERR